MNYYYTSSGDTMRMQSYTEVLEYHDLQILTWTEDREIPRKTRWIRQPQKISKHTHAPINRFSRPFRKHLFRVGKSKK